ncbi:phosphonate metabolism protein/1,5-bisphosphokinase (PRPP-forming) PhnN [Variovorax sp. JS1663]|uniref:phosphonate metabolism protein/1,5-bisphosphokinase (PRPP-forming) PhnN n=1 Tax=Variovorax sp. JS1663 TaxID=1851577 RepID=UPI000B3488EE|nr:phosphonate metabolism protein/1,5-bisphosphokinase (PRPP-forming) PhnN [Variovorax sp. JS1663]OUM04067.1 phosphonate metabolism protein/1,5-bisphosphokinase (PRPP-forming) PhnN [Variovorax sp. JS1663]
MESGTFFLVVGPSGAGKDALIDGARQRLSGEGRHVFARRTITRPAAAPGEDHESISPAEFDRRESAGDFLVTWRAHGLCYGLPTSLRGALEAGQDVVANGSRSVIAQLSQCLARLVVIEVTAAPEVLAQRIAARGREREDEMQLRLARRGAPLPASVRSLGVDNDAGLPEGIDRFVEALESFRSWATVRCLEMRSGADGVVHLPATGADAPLPAWQGGEQVELSALGGRGITRVRARVHVGGAGAALAAGEVGLSRETFEALGAPPGSQVALRAIPAPRSHALLAKKIRGEELNEAQYRRLLRDFVEGRYADRELTAFLVAATQKLSDAEVLSLARVRASLAHRQTWNERIVVDKHSMGGVPGSRITPIVVSLVAAHGLAMPKTSSRAITSAAGTADVMEAVARVDLTVDEVQRCIAEARACIAWNGRLNHSVLDDVMNALTRPLGLDSARWSVASILSKKKAAGATHVIVDLPYGTYAKLRTEQAALELAALFEATGAGIGLHVRALATDGSRPIGRGIGPALELRDVLRVLDNHPGAPADLRDKALRFASQILAWDPLVGSAEKGRTVAQALLDSGAARRAFARIVQAQGAHEEPARPSALTHAVRAEHGGVVSGIDGWTIAGIARLAGAPVDKGSGIDLLCQVGDAVRAGDPLCRIHAASSDSLAACVALVQSAHPIDIAAERPQAHAGRGAGPAAASMRINERSRT